MLDWDDLRFLAALARGGSYAAAGRALSVSHTTVARRLAAMAERLGVALVEPDAQGIRLTDAGREAYAAAERCETELRELEASLCIRDPLAGALRVTTVDLLASLLTDALASFAARHPAITLEVTVDAGLADLARREADVALRVARAAPPAQLVGVKVAPVRFARYASEALLERGAPLPWIEWAGVPLGEPGRVAARTASAALLYELCRAGVGAAVLPRFLADAEPALRRLPGRAETLQLWVLTHPGLRASPRVRALLDHLRTALAPLARRLREA